MPSRFRAVILEVLSEAYGIVLLRVDVLAGDEALSVDIGA